MNQIQTSAKPNEALRKKLKARKRITCAANTVIAGFGCSVGLLLLIPTMGMLPLLGIPALIVSLFIIPFAYRKHKEAGTHKRLLHLARCTGICLLAALYLSPVVCKHFERVPLLFPVKRFVFIHGVRNPEIGKTVMPMYLPKKHDNYWFRTESQKLGPDYTPFAFLFLHTDTETLRAYDEKLSSNPHLERMPNHDLSDTETCSLNAEYAMYTQNLPYFIYEIMTDNADIHDDLTNAVVFMGDNSGIWHCGSGACINYETGLLIAWI